MMMGLILKILLYMLLCAGTMDCCGLMSVEKKPVPLQSIEVQLEVRDHVATVFSTLNYHNKEDKPIEAVFVFPLPGDAAVCQFSAKIGQTEVVAEVKEKQQAGEDYHAALSSGQQAFLLEESEQSPDIFTLSVGSLPAGESASIRLQYVTALAVQADGGLRFSLPAVLNPRYRPQGSEGASVQVTSVPASLVPYSLSVSARVSSPRPVSKVESNCSLDPVQYLDTDQTQATVKLAAGHKFDRDVELVIYYEDAHQPSAVVEAGQASAPSGTVMGDPVVMLSLYPEFPQSVMSSLAQCGEFVLLLDRSGSMGSAMNRGVGHQSRIASARDSLLLLLKSLPMGCYFNIYSFGSDYQHVFPQSVEYSQSSMEEAVQKVETMEADLGGTEILKPLQHIYSQRCISSQPRQLFVFTDGEVFNTKDVIDLVKKNSASHRCFSFGMGEGASSALIDGMAQEGRGHAHFITGKDRMQPKVMQSLRFALQPTVTDISVTWDLPEGVSVTVLSPPITALFQGQRSLVYAQLTGQSSEAAEGSVTVKSSLAGRRYDNTLRFSLTPAEDTGLTVHRLAARSLIGSLEMEEREHRGRRDGGVKEKVVELSVQSGVSSSYTAFVAVNKGSGEPLQGPLVRRNVPTAYARARCRPIMTSRSRNMIFPVEAYSGASARAKNIFHLDQPFEGIYRSAFEQPAFNLSARRAASGTQSLRCDSLDRKYKAEGKWNKRKSETMSAEETNQPAREPLLQLVSLQRASGCWLLGPGLAAALGKTSEELDKAKPASVKQEVWATTLALVWLHAVRLDAEEEWELLAMKAASWLRAHNAPYVAECVEAANTLLGCSVQKNVLGL